MIIGIPRERKTLEKRVALTPDGAAELKALGHKIIIEKDAGVGSSFSNQEYTAAGANIVESLEEVWGAAELLVKVKEPDSSEFPLFRKGQTVFTFLHLARLPEVAKALVARDVTGFAYELVRDELGRFPLLEPMSEVAGRLSVLNGSYYLLSQNGGRGILLGGAVGVNKGNVVIVGAGVAGRAACEVAVGMGAHVTILDRTRSKLQPIAELYGNKVQTLLSSSASLLRVAASADLMIGAVLIPGAKSPRVISRDIIKGMPRGSVVVDISIDQGGCCETSRTTSLKEPTFVEDGVIHYCVPNMPAQTPRTSTLALAAASLPFIIKLGSKSADEILASEPELKAALNTYKGNITNKAVAEALGMPFVG